MRRHKIVFDVDCTLITPDRKPKYDVIELYKWFQNHGWDMYIHSGCGIDYAKTWAEKLGLEPCKIAPKGSPDYKYDIAVDDALDSEVCVIEGHKYYVNAKTYIII